jgi:hypothetical protein
MIFLTLTPLADPPNNNQLSPPQHRRPPAQHDAPMGLRGRPSRHLQHLWALQRRVADSAADLNGVEFDYMDSVLLL